jgi:hypothetical protein
MCASKLGLGTWQQQSWGRVFPSTPARLAGLENCFQRLDCRSQRGRENRVYARKKLINHLAMREMFYYVVED